VSTARRIVIKVGSSTLAGDGVGIDRAYVRDLCAQIAQVHGDGAQVVLVSSGAIAAGLERLGMTARPADMPSLQAAASVGQVALVETYAVMFGEQGLAVGQVLLTRHDTGHREAYLHACDTLERLMSLGVVPVVNENDTVAVDEIRFGDNDTLAALVATMVHADLVVLLSDIEGLYDKDPRTTEQPRLVDYVDEWDESIAAAAGGVGSGVGSGGMTTKVEAARALMRAGVHMVICDGRRPNVIVDAVAGKPVGTAFAGGEAAVGARKMWIALGRRPAGDIVIDDGARNALVTGGKSLLPAGVVQVSGSFRPGDAVVLKDRSGAVVGQGLAELSAVDLDRVKGLKTAQIAEVLGHSSCTEAVHRDRLVIL